MTYSVRWASRARRAIEVDLPGPVAAAVWEFVNGPLAQSPRCVGKELLGVLAGTWSARRGQYRVIYVIDDDTIVVAVVRLDRRRDVYR